MSEPPRSGTMKYFSIIMILFISLTSVSLATEKKETPHYDVANEYIRSLGTIYSSQKIAAKEK